MNETSKNLGMVFVYDAENNRHKACIVEYVPLNRETYFVKWIKPTTYHHLIPDFLRDEFTKSNKKLLRPVNVIGLPKEWYSKKKK